MIKEKQIEEDFINKLIELKYIYIGRIFVIESH